MPSENLYTLSTSGIPIRYDFGTMILLSGSQVTAVFLRVFSEIRHFPIGLRVSPFMRVSSCQDVNRPVGVLSTAQRDPVINWQWYMALLSAIQATSTGKPIVFFTILVDRTFSSASGVVPQRPQVLGDRWVFRLVLLQGPVGQSLRFVGASNELSSFSCRHVSGTDMIL